MDQTVAMNIYKVNNLYCYHYGCSIKKEIISSMALKIKSPMSIQSLQLNKELVLSNII